MSCKMWTCSVTGDLGTSVMCEHLASRSALVFEAGVCPQHQQRGALPRYPRRRAHAPGHQHGEGHEGGFVHHVSHLQLTREGLA